MQVSFLRLCTPVLSIFLLALLTCGASTVNAETTVTPTAPKSVSETASPVSAGLQPFVETGHIAGFVSIISDSKGNIQTECIGWRDLEKTHPMTSDTMFWIASTSKFLTCAAVLMAVDEGKIDLDAPIEQYLPEFQTVQVQEKQADGTIILRAPKTKPTVRQALSHTAGLRFFVNHTLDERPLSELSREVAALPLIHEPGTIWSYSNLGIDLGATILEKVTGMKFEDFLRQRLFEPLGMKDTTFWPTSEQLSRMAKAYEIKDGKTCEIPLSVMQPLDQKEGRFAEAGGGLFSTPADIFRFVQLMANHGVFNGKRLLSEASVQALASKQTPENVSNTYGFGTHVSGGWFGHGGAYGTDAQANIATGACGIYFVQVSGNHPDRQAAQSLWLEKGLKAAK